MWEWNGIRFFQGVGSREEIAYENGKTCAPLVSESALPYFSGRIDRSIRQSSLVKKYPFLGEVLTRWVHFRYFGALARCLPAEDMKVLRAFADGAKVSLDLVLRAFLVPDVGQYLLGQMYRSNRYHLSKFASLPFLGCSTFLLPTSDGTVFARNLDYDGGGIFDWNASIYYQHPREEHAFVHFGTLGMPLGVITGYNAHGLCLSLHQLMVQELSSKGTPILCVTDQIMRSARNLDDAERILRDHQHPSTWRLILYSSREKRAITAETSRSGVDVCEFDALQNASTNSAQAERLQTKEFSPGFNYYRDSRLRHHNLKLRMKSLSHPQIEDAVDLLSSTEVCESSWKETTCGGTVARRNNVHSVIIHPEKKTAYFAVPPVRYARSYEGKYYEIPLIDQTPQMSLEERVRSGTRTLQRSIPFSENAIQANALYRKACISISENGRWDEGVKLLREAEKIHNEDPVYPLMLGITLLSRVPEVPKADKLSLLQECIQCLKRAEIETLTGYHVSLLNLIYARALALQGDLVGQRKHLDKVDTSYAQTLRETVDRERIEGYRESDLRTMVVDYLNIDFFRL